MSIIPKPPFPNVPKLPGVPQLSRSPNFPTGSPQILGIGVAAARLFTAFFVRPVWGVFKEVPTTPEVTEDADGVQTVTVSPPKKLVPVVVPDSIREFSYRNEWNVSDYPVQDGSFASYNKVNNPFEIQLRMTKGGSLSDRQDFLAQIDAISGTLDLYQIITPEKTYHNCNVIRYEVGRRGVGGAFFLSEVDIFFREIRIVQAQYTETASDTQFAKDVSARGITNIGTTQAGDPPASLGALA
jgi:hypothetical protein